MKTFKHYFSNIFGSFPSALILLAMISSVGCGGGSSSEKTTFESDNQAPTISISSPSANSTFVDGETVNFVATASDPEDGDISENIIWYSDIAGEIGRGANINVTLEAAVHDIMAEIRDSKNSTSRDSVTIEIAANTGMATLTWSAPIENTDGSTLTDLAGFRIYYGVQRDNLTNSITLNDPQQTTHVIENLAAGRVMYFAISSFNRHQVESELSQIVSKEI